MAKFNYTFKSQNWFAFTLLLTFILSLIVVFGSVYYIALSMGIPSWIAFIDGLVATFFFWVMIIEPKKKHKEVEIE